MILVDPVRKAAAAACLCLGLAACSPTFQNHGYVPPQEEIEAILPGVDTRESLAETIGEPSASGVVASSGWFYAAYTVRSFAYTAPEVVERDVLAIAFDADGVVSGVERYGLEDGQFVRLSRRVTDNGIGNVTLWQQIITNFGRIDVAEAIAGDD